MNAPILNPPASVLYPTYLGENLELPQTILGTILGTILPFMRGRGCSKLIKTSRCLYYIVSFQQISDFGVSVVSFEQVRQMLVGTKP